MADINSYIKEERAQGLKSADSKKTAKENSALAGLRTEFFGGKRITDRPASSNIKVKKRLPVVVDVIAGILMLVLVLAVIVGSYMLFRYFSNDYDKVNVEYKLSVRVELMADCLAGVWAKNSNDKWNALEPGDIQEAMNAASAIGDDKLQKQSQGYAVPDSFTHGSSAQRQRWFMTGYKSGQTKSCDTFRAARG